MFSKNPTCFWFMSCCWLVRPLGSDSKGCMNKWGDYVVAEKERRMRCMMLHWCNFANLPSWHKTNSSMDASHGSLEFYVRLYLNNKALQHNLFQLVLRWWWDNKMFLKVWKMTRKHQSLQLPRSSDSITSTFLKIFWACVVEYNLWGWERAAVQQGLEK